MYHILDFKCKNSFECVLIIYLSVYQSLVRLAMQGVGVGGSSKLISKR
jgi:hypothetical protein